MGCIEQTKFSYLIFLAIISYMLALSSASSQQSYVRIHSWYDPNRNDNFITTDPGWAGEIGDTRSPNYTLFRIEGFMFAPDQQQPAGTVPVYSWYSDSRDDNFMTSHPSWQGSPGETRLPDYNFVRLEGYVFDPEASPPKGTVPLYSWYDPDRGDNFATTNRVWAGSKGVPNKSPNYAYVRREGYVLPYHPTTGLVDIRLPVYFLFEYNDNDPITGLPIARLGDVSETIFDIDDALTRMNAALADASGLDGRRLRFVRAAVKYIQSSPGLCSDYRTLLSDIRVVGALQVYVTLDTGACPHEAFGPWRNRASSASLAHEIGHNLGLHHYFERTTIPIEFLFRDLDPTSDSSCYERGDRLCDTPPDYGFITANDNTGTQCDNNPISVSCTQTGPICDTQDPVIDGRGLCEITGSEEGTRTYDPAKLGHVVDGRPNNIMAYHNQDEFTYEQFVAALDYSLWRIGSPDLVPGDEKFVFDNFDLIEPIWQAAPDDEQRLSRARIVTPPARSVGNDWQAQVTSSVGEKLFSFRVDISGTGTPAPSGSRVTITTPTGARLVASGRFLLKEEGRIVLDEAYGFDQSSIRGAQPYGDWTIQIDTTDAFTVNDVTLSVVGYD